MTAISLCDSPVYRIKLRAFIFGSVIHLYWGYPQGRNYASVSNILEIMNFKISILHFFGSFGINAKDTKFISGTPHTHTEIQIHTGIYTQTYTDRYKYNFYILHFLAHLAYMQKILIL